MIEHFNKVHKWKQQWTYVSCWHNSDQENAQMRSAYAPKGIALKTKYSLLAANLPENSVIGPVLYRDYAKDFVTEGT
jgi:hypothetical protein